MQEVKANSRRGAKPFVREADNDPFECPHSCCRDIADRPSVLKNWGTARRHAGRLRGGEVRNPHVECDPGCTFRGKNAKELMAYFQSKRGEPVRVRLSVREAKEPAAATVRAAPVPAFLKDVSASEATTNAVAVNAWTTIMEDKPLLRLASQPAELWKSYGYALLPACAKAQNCIETVGQLLERGGNDIGNEEIAGRVIQLNLAAVVAPRLQKCLKSQWRQLVRNALRSVGEDLAGRAPLNDHKLLLAAPGRGSQSVHWDVPAPDDEHPQRAHCISVLLYCTATMSTALPRFPSSLLSWPLIDPVRGASLTFLAQPQWFHSIDVEAGSVLLLRCATPHYGVANPSSALGARRVLFDLITSVPLRDDSEQSAFQHFAHMFLFDVLGVSFAFIDCVNSNRPHLGNPLHRQDREHHRELILQVRRLFQSFSEWFNVLAPAASDP